MFANDANVNFKLDFKKLFSLSSFHLKKVWSNVFKFKLSSMCWIYLVSDDEDFNAGSGFFVPAWLWIYSTCMQRVLNLFNCFVDTFQARAVNIGGSCLHKTWIWHDVTHSSECGASGCHRLGSHTSAGSLLIHKWAEKQAEWSVGAHTSHLWSHPPVNQL